MTIMPVGGPAAAAEEPLPAATADRSAWSDDAVGQIRRSAGFINQGPHELKEGMAEALGTLTDSADLATFTEEQTRQLSAQVPPEADLPVEPSRLIAGSPEQVVVLDVYEQPDRLVAVTSLVSGPKGGGVTALGALRVNGQKVTEGIWVTATDASGSVVASFTESYTWNRSVSSSSASLPFPCDIACAIGAAVFGVAIGAICAPASVLPGGAIVCATIALLAGFQANELCKQLICDDGIAQVTSVECGTSTTTCTVEASITTSQQLSTDERTVDMYFYWIKEDGPLYPNHFTYTIRYLPFSQTYSAGGVSIYTRREVFAPIPEVRQYVDQCTSLVRADIYSKYVRDPASSTRKAPKLVNSPCRY